MKYLLTILATVLILVAVLLPGSSVPDVDVIGFDKLVHVTMFAGWTFAVCRDFSVSARKFLVVFLAGLAFSITTEFLQIFVEDRTFDWLDFLADGIGILVGGLLTRPILRLLSAS